MKASKTSWRPRPKEAIIKDNEVHLWCASLILNSKILTNLRLALSTDEIARAKRFHFQNDRDGFIAGRGILRSILAHYLKTKPTEIGFTYNTNGKPSIANMPGTSGINFNLSHSHGLAVYAFTRSRGVGVDIERLRSNLSYERIAKRFFTEVEYKELSSLADEDFLEGFFKLWTHKEAYIKARGKGLSIPLNKFGLFTDTDQKLRIIHAEKDQGERCSLSFHTFIPAAGYVGALAVEGKNLRFRHWIWQQ